RGYEGNTTRQRREGSDTQSILKRLGSDWVARNGRKMEQKIPASNKCWCGDFNIRRKLSLVIDLDSRMDF
ncbi:MAG: hypothetical protein RRY39_10895, partial [Odoribacter sp.]